MLSYEEEEEFLPEVNIFERVHYEVPSASRSELQNDPVKRFQVYTNAAASNMSANGLLPINRDDVNEINKQASIVRNPQYKNHLGFVIGYYLIKNGNNDINRTNLGYVKQNLDRLSPDKLLKLQDLIRYGRLWLTQL